MKRFNEMQNVGKVRYVVSHHDGEKQHADGSPFFDIAIFHNKHEKEQFVKDLQRQGYRPTNY